MVDGPSQRRVQPKAQAGRPSRAADDYPPSGRRPLLRGKSHKMSLLIFSF